MVGCYRKLSTRYGIEDLSFHPPAYYKWVLYSGLAATPFTFFSLIIIIIIIIIGEIQS